MDSVLGRWTRRDPLGYVDSLSLYAHARSNPVARIDPLGLCCGASFAGSPVAASTEMQPVDPCAGDRLNLQAANEAWETAVMQCLSCRGVWCFITCANAMSSARGWIQSACIALQNCEHAHGMAITSCDNGGNPPTSDPPTTPDLPDRPTRNPPLTPGSPSPLWPDTCDMTGSLASCVSCCVKNHGREVFDCGVTYLQEYRRCWWDSCRREAGERYRTCIQNSQFRYEACIQNCKTAFPGQTLPNPPPEAIPVPDNIPRGDGAVNPF